MSDNISQFDSLQTRIVGCVDKIQKAFNAYYNLHCKTGYCVYEISVYRVSLASYASHLGNIKELSMFTAFI